LDSTNSASIDDEKRTDESVRCVTSLDNIPTDILGTAFDFLSLQTICRIRSVSLQFESNATKVLRRFTKVDCGDVAPDASIGYDGYTLSNSEILSNSETDVLFGIIRTIRDCCPNVEKLKLTEYEPHKNYYKLLTFTADHVGWGEWRSAVGNYESRKYLVLFFSQKFG
jgi:hypothetical protein